MITNSSFPPARDSTPQGKSASAFLFPSFRYLPDIPLDEDSLDRFVRAFLLPRDTHRAHNILPEEKRAAMKRVPELEETFRNVMDLKYSPTVLICGHGQRDPRCGIMGPILQTEFRHVLTTKGFLVGGAADDVGHVNLGLISHIGGHKYAGNVIIYLPPPPGPNENAPGTLAGKGIWYGRVEPRHVQGIVEETILKGRVIANHFRGAVGHDGQVLRL